MTCHSHFPKYSGETVEQVVHDLRYWIPRRGLLLFVFAAVWIFAGGTTWALLELCKVFPQPVQIGATVFATVMTGFTYRFFRLFCAPSHEFAMDMKFWLGNLCTRGGHVEKLLEFIEERVRKNMGHPFFIEPPARRVIRPPGVDEHGRIIIGADFHNHNDEDVLNQFGIEVDDILPHNEGLEEH